MSRSRLSLVALLIALLAMCLSPAGVSAAQKLITIQVPSRFVDPATQKFNGPDHPRRLQANVLLPDGYDGTKRFPLLLLLHGAGDNWESWSNPTKGDIANTAKGLRAVVVMPDGATGFYADWWNDARRTDPAWERYFREFLIPEIQRRFRIRPARRWHAIAGLSMGGYGTLLTASQNPGYFGSAVSMSAFANPQRPESVAAFPAVTGASYETIFGPPEGFYADAHNPVKLAANLAHTRMQVFTGDGTVDPAVGPPSNPLSALLETGLKFQNDEFVDALQAAGATTQYTVHPGSHDWPFWRADLRTAIARGLFRPVAERPYRWRFTTSAQRGRMWDLRYRFDAPPTQVIDFSRAGRRLSATGSGHVTIYNRGCKLTVSLPFSRALPKPPCR